MIICTSKAEAWEIASYLAGNAQFVPDSYSTRRAGYPIYRVASNVQTYVCDLNTRLEVNLPDGRSRNVYIACD